MSETLTNGVIVPDKGSRDWYADLRSNWLKLDSLMAGGNITINPAQTDGILVATITVGGKEYKLYQQDGDVSVKIDPSTENAEYPLVASTSAEANTGSVVMAPAVTVNPSTGALTATSFKGKLEGNASTATKATQDASGNVITSTYATKTELNTKANDNNVVHKSGDETITGTKTIKTSIVADVGGGPVLKVADGAEVFMFRKDYALIPGGVILRCPKDDNTYIDFKILNNGTIVWNKASILTDANQIMVLKNLTGNKITSGAVIDCGTGNGMLVGWFMNTAGKWVLANNKPQGKWKNANNFSLLAEESGMFVKVG